MRAQACNSPVAPRACGSQGFSLIEVMVALVICSIGLLGLAKMESLGLASTGVAGGRSLAAIQASSLAAMMHADRAYWGGGFAPASFTVNASPGSAVVISDAGLSAASAANCTLTGAASCAPASLAGYDLLNWGNDLKALLPTYLATITCSTAGFPVSCAIEIQWAENGVAINAQQKGNMAALNAPTYILYVEP